MRVNKKITDNLFPDVDEVITGTDSFILYDVTLPYLKETTKTCQVQLYAVCHRDILDDYSKEGFYGNRADILTEMVENALLYFAHVVSFVYLVDIIKDG